MCIHDPMSILESIGLGPPTCSAVHVQCSHAFPRAKINGAKALCNKRHATHVRRFHGCMSNVQFHGYLIHSSYVSVSLSFEPLLNVSPFLWSNSHRKNLYDGVEEYYVVVKEKGQREKEQVEEEIRKKNKGLEAG